MSHTDAKHRRIKDLNAKVKSEGRTEGGISKRWGGGGGRPPQPSSPASPRTQTGDLTTGKSVCNSAGMH